MRIWWCDRFERAEIDEGIEWCKTEHVSVGEKCGPMRLIPDKPPLTVNHCPQNYWEPGLGPCICRGSKHPALDGETP